LRESETDECERQTEYSYDEAKKLPNGRHLGNSPFNFGYIGRCWQLIDLYLHTFHSRAKIINLLFDRSQACFEIVAAASAAFPGRKSAFERLINSVIKQPRIYISRRFFSSAHVLPTKRDRLLFQGHRTPH